MVRIRSRVKIRVRIRARVRVSVSHIMTIWRWEEFFRCDKFPTTPVLDLSNPERWKAELTLVLVILP